MAGAYIYHLMRIIHILMQDNSDELAVVSFDIRLVKWDLYII